MHSMTGYGTATGKVGRGRLYIEIKTINHRYCEISFRMPPRMGSLEANLRNVLQAKFKRGKIEVFLKELEPIFGGTELQLNVELARQYQGAIKRLQKSLKLPQAADPLSLMGVQSFIHSKEKEGDYISFWSAIQKVLLSAVAQADRMRAKEGAHLLKDQKQRLKSLVALLVKIETQAFHNAKARRTVLTTNPANGNLETNLSVDKMDITEEVTRLKSHAKQYGGILQSREPIGRKLDFLIQEMHREINTIGAKAADAGISAHVVDGKALLENLREQIQNIE